jgi:hypothetical protein
MALVVSVVPYLLRIAIPCMLAAAASAQQFIPQHFPMGAAFPLGAGAIKIITHLL